MNVIIFEPIGSKDPTNCEFCPRPIDGTEPAESLIQEISMGKYGKLVIAHRRCIGKSKVKLHRVGSFSVIKQVTRDE